MLFIYCNEQGVHMLVLGTASAGLLLLQLVITMLGTVRCVNCVLFAADGVQWQQ
jgi:hypothetical protein